MAVSSLRLLGQIITDSIDIIERRMADASLSFPSLDEPFNSTSKVESVLVEPDMSKATSHIIAAAAQLTATVRRPVQTIMDDALAFHLSWCIRAAIDGSLVEIVREAGPQGIHINDIARKNKTDPLKVARILRLLTNNHIFQEISPDVFASNRLSSVLDSGKSSEEVVGASIAERHVGTSGVAAFAAMMSDEGMKAAAILPEHFLDPTLSFSGEPDETPFNRAFDTKLSLFDWYKKEKNEAFLRRFGLAMFGSRKLEPADAILTGFQWKDLPKGSTIVDVGGGVGSLSLIIAEAVPDINIVIQDGQLTIAHAEEFWKANMPSAITSGRVQLQVHDFFHPQPVKDASAFLLRSILHDWADPYVQKILKSLRAAATPETKLVVVDAIVPYSCIAEVTSAIPGAALEPAPFPLLPSLGKANGYAYQADMTMWAYFNGQNRTLGHSVALAEECGWKIIQVHRIPGSSFGQIVAVPM
ncbi:O-methyltransferase [Gymnopus androsaceus JB14]|uniref:O-methyltransferase n=1 Tax=Gymnopus androsaceus JB14 TaxID=1447944 RepID=A0A6A4GM40_9AGAR|nr:O-methyltransferase [Gymnopus androsaceus JB14]